MSLMVFSLLFAGCQDDLENLDTETHPESNLELTKAEVEYEASVEINILGIIKFKLGKKVKRTYERPDGSKVNTTEDQGETEETVPDAKDEVEDVITAEGGSVTSGGTVKDDEGNSTSFNVNNNDYSNGASMSGEVTFNDSSSSESYSSSSSDGDGFYGE